jgi:putative transcriptional regulator
MGELIFTSSLSNQEIDDNFKNIDFFSGIMAGLEEALAYEKGTARAATFARKRNLPQVDASAIRKSMNMTQKDFANILGVSKRTIEAWETGRSTPSPTAKNLLYLIQNNPDLVAQLQNR